MLIYRNNCSNFKYFSYFQSPQYGILLSMSLDLFKNQFILLIIFKNIMTKVTLQMHNFINSKLQDTMHIILEEKYGTTN